MIGHSILGCLVDQDKTSFLKWPHDERSSDFKMSLDIKPLKRTYNSLITYFLNFTFSEHI